MSDWARVSSILERALDLPPGERDRFFTREAGADAALLDELRALSRSYDQAEASAFIDRPLAAAEPDLILNTLHPGQRIGSYEILAEAGRGGMGVVYRARDTRLGRDVAVKCVAEGASPSQKARLENEARMAARISHPAIATVYALEEEPSTGSGQGGGQLFLISEFVDGETLRARVSKGPIAGPELARFAKAIAHGLAAAHREGVAHGDLKPENIIVRPSGDIKILDFGLAETRTGVAPLAAADAVAGTPGYMAPEQLRGQPADARADVFAYGVLLFEMATGRHPFAGDRGSMLEAALSNRAAFDTHELPAAIAAIVARCLAPDPSNRFSTAAELASALETALASSTRVATASRAVWWFLAHQRIVAALVAAMPIVAWIARPAFSRPWGSLVFLLTLAGATAVVALRLNADFIAREHPSELRRHLDAVGRRMWMAELALDACAMAAGMALADRLDWAAGLLFGGGVASIIALSVIEPATTRAALRAISRERPRRD
ncbi:MAG: serine/threonine-protein kinase [Vicinamibacterales bacterium]